ncbi:MAG: protein kinase, partial [Vicinamibacterales bacterium]
MALSAGARLGPYEVVSPIGAGGMGEVYRARDTRLGRDVAVKVLPASFADDPERRTRFEREAQAIAALSHSNILAIHDTGVHDGQIYLVMELLDGETLRDRLRTGALPSRKAVEIAVQIARGLAAAHARGLVHRDLKPENVFLLKDGQVKILDFGLARAVGTGSGATETVPVVTDPGTVMGTVGYMAPEQVRGQAVDQRADLFAFGAVLYEMLSGQRAFKRGTPAETMTAILNEEPPDPGTTRSGVSPALDSIVRHCLEKNPVERFQSARDIAFALESLSGSGASKAIDAVAPRRGWWRPVMAIGAVVLAAAGGLWIGRRTAPQSDVRYDVKTWDRETIYNARFAPDGSIVYSAAHVGMTPELFILHPNRTAPERLGESGTHLLSVSSTGELAVLTNTRFIEHRLFRGTLARLTPGAAPRPWLDDVRDADWSPDGSTLAVIHVMGEGRDRLEYPSGTALYEIGGYLSDPRVSHDGQRVAFVEHHDPWDDRGSVKVVDRTLQVLALTDEYSGVEGVAWSADDTEILFSATVGSTPGLQVWAVPSTRRAVARIALRTPGDAIILDVDRTGRWLLSKEEQRWNIVIKRPGDAAEQGMSWMNFSSGALLSHDGSLMAFTSQNIGEGLDYAVLLRKTDGSPPARLGDGSGIRRIGLSPDNRWVAAWIFSTHTLVFYPTGAGAPQRLTVPADGDFGGWFSDSRHVLLMEALNGAPSRCYRQAIAGGAPEPLPPEDADFCLTLPDDEVLLHTRSGKMRLYDRPGGTGVPAQEPDNVPVGFEPGGFAFISTPMPDQGFRIERMNLRTGDKTPIVTVAIADRAGLVKVQPSSLVGGPGRYG